jgi:hypothetical protein
MKRELRAWGYNWVILSLGGHTNKRPSPPDWGFYARLMTLLCKKITVVKSSKVKTRCNLAGSSMEGYCSKRAVLPMMIPLITVHAY